MFEKLLQGPSGEPLTVEQQAVFSRFDAPEAMIGSPATDNPEYLEIQSQIGAAREQIEKLTNFCFLTQKWQLQLDAFPKIYLGQDQAIRHWNIPTPSPYRPDVLELLRHPVQSVESVKYLDADGVEQTLDPSVYDLKNDRLVLKTGQAWPITSRTQDCVTVVYTAGYVPDGSPAVPIPQRLIRALKFLAGWYYENRIPVSSGPTSDVNFTLCNLLTGFRSNYMAR